MPAIRYYFQCNFALADHIPGGHPVDVLCRDGSYTRLDWLGMICEAALERLPGLGRVKLRAYAVTSGDGISKCDWYHLAKGEYVLGWRCATRHGQGVYGVLDRELWPIVVGGEGRGRRGIPILKVVG